MRTMVLLAVLIAFPMRPSAQPDGLFAPAPGSPLRVGQGSGTIILADVNGDRHLDMVTRHLLTKQAVVLMGNGRGDFVRSRTITFDYEPGDLAAGDLNDDGVLDLAVTPGRQDVVDIYLGSGNGAFTKTAASPIIVSAGVEPFNKRTLRLADVNEDGHLDIITANGRRKTTMGVLFGDGGGGFTSGPHVALDSLNDGYAFALADFDGDGHLDVVTASREGYGEGRPGQVSFQRGDGKGSFASAFQRAVTLSGPRTVAVADVNGDRRPDVLIGHDRGQLSVLLNADGMSFAHAEGSPFNLHLQTHAIRPADVTGDSRIDLVAATVDSVTVLVGDGRRFAPGPGSPFKAGPGAYNLTLGDVNEDGKIDVAASSFEGEAVTLLLRR
jgi:hypothetical protein